MALTDSVDKIVTRYFAVVTTEHFIYKDKTYKPKPLSVSPLLLRDFTCPEGCGACCPRFSLDYIPVTETNDPEMPDHYIPKLRTVEFNGYKVSILSDLQDDHNDYHCRHLNKSNGRCGIYQYRPFSCDFELIRPLIFEDPEIPNQLTQKLFGRKWAMKRIDEKSGTLCEMISITDHSIDEVIRKLHRLGTWCYYFGIGHKCYDIIEWLIEIRPYVDHRKISNKLF